MTNVNQLRQFSSGFKNLQKTFYYCIFVDIARIFRQRGLEETIFIVYN